VHYITSSPTSVPAEASISPTLSPSQSPIVDPTTHPSSVPTITPSRFPTLTPTANPLESTETPILYASTDSETVNNGIGKSSGSEDSSAMVLLTVVIILVSIILILCVLYFICSINKKRKLVTLEMVRKGQEQELKSNDRSLNADMKRNNLVANRKNSDIFSNERDTVGGEPRNKNKSYMFLRCFSKV